MTRTFLMAALLVGCGGATEEGEKAGGRSVDAPSAIRSDVAVPIAHVAGAPVGEADLLAHAARNHPANGATYTPEERARLVDEVLTDELLFQTALEKGLYHDAKVRKILVNLLLRTEVYSKVTNGDFSEDELRRYYDEHKDTFVVPAKVHARRILVRIGPDGEAAAKARAEDLHLQLKKDRTQFSKLALEHSDGSHKRRGGDLGFVAREGKPGVEPEVIAHAFDMRVDELSSPIKVGDAFHILLVVNKRDKVERSFQQMKGSVLRMVKQQRFEERRTAYIDELKKTMAIEIDQAKVDGLDLERRRDHGPGPGPVEHAHGKNDGHH